MILLLLFFVACAWATRCCKGCTLQRPKLRPRCPVNQAWCVVLSSWGSCPSFVYCVGHCYKTCGCCGDSIHKVLCGNLPPSRTYAAWEIWGLCAFCVSGRFSLQLWKKGNAVRFFAECNVSRTLRFSHEWLVWAAPSLLSFPFPPSPSPLSPLMCRR